MRKLTGILFAFCLQISLFPQSINYRELFGENWKKAVTFEKENRSWMESVLRKNHISYRVAISVIFPELVRYSALRDKMETTLLKTLYVNLGEDYADFSVGPFQMKPSFAEKIIDLTPSVNKKIRGIKLKNKSDFDDTRTFRKYIVNSLDEPEAEFKYLVLFLRICENKFGINPEDEHADIRFLATAYNYGIDKSYSGILNMTDRKFFNTKLISSRNYSYADVSLFWFNDSNGSK